MAFALPILPFIAAGAAVFEGVQSAQAAAYQGAVAKNNAITAARNAQYSAAAGAANTEKAGLEARERSARVRAAIAAGGVDVNSGSAADVQTSQRELGFLNTANEANKSALNVYGYESQRSSFLAQEKMYNSEVPGDIIGGVLKGASSLLSAEAELPPQYQWMKGGGDSASSSDIFGGADTIDQQLNPDDLLPYSPGAP